jgi:WD40 repeat protein
MRAIVCSHIRSMTTYKIGGSLPANAPTYVERQADRDLDRYLQAGEFCYVLNSRQMGKSSLKLRTIQTLTTAGVACVDIDLSGVGTEGVSAAQWYYSIADELATEFDLESELETFWDCHPQLSDVKRLGKFIDTIVLAQITSKIVIFVDEIDKVISLGSFTDDFFGLIRNCAERQATSSNYQRLCFVLLGVATPTDLIKNKQIAPFNIGRAIELNGFQSTDDLAPLRQGLAGISADPIATLTEILYWTGGQPFLTQKLCQLAVESPQSSISEIVNAKIINNWKDRDNPVHLRTIEARLLTNRELANHLLQQYRYIITSESSLIANNTLEQQWLKLSGLVVEISGKLQVYNPIYVRVFSRDWIDRELANICPYGQALTDWLNNGRPDERLLHDRNLLDEAILWKEFQGQQNQSIGIEGASFIDRSQTKRINRKLKKLIEILSVLIITGFILLLTLIWFDRSLKISDKVNELDRVSNRIIGQYEFAPIESLKAAISNAKRFQSLQPTLLGNATPTPKLALQKLVDSIQEIDEIHTYQQGINSVYFCKDDRIFTAGNDGSINLWDRNSVNQTQVLTRLKNEVKTNSLAWENNNCTDILVSGSSDGYIRLWKVGRAALTQRLHSQIEAMLISNQTVIHHVGGIQNVRLLRDRADRHLYVFSTGLADGKLRKWRVDRDRELTLIWERSAHHDGVISLNLSGNKDRIGTAGKDKTAKIWDLDGNLIQTLTGHLGSVNSINFCATGTQNCHSSEIQIATSSNDGTVRLWSLDGTFIKQIDVHIGEVRAVRFSPDGYLLATASAQDPTASNGSSVRIWNLKDSKLVTEFKGHHGPVESMRFNPSFNQKGDDFRQLVTSGHDDSTIRVWQIPEIVPAEQKHQAKITSVRFDPTDSHYFITAGEDGKIGWWSHQVGATPNRIDSFPNRDHRGQFQTIRIHPKNGRDTIAVGDAEGTVRLLKIDDRQKIVEIGSFNANQGKLESMDWNYEPYGNNPNRYLLATTGTIGNDVNIWEIDLTENKFRSLRLVSFYNWEFSNLSLRFSRDGNNLGIGAEQGKVVLLKNINHPGRQPIEYPLQLPQDISSKVTIGFSPDNRSLTIVSKEGKIWRSNMQAKSIDDRPIETYQAGTENIAINSKNSEIATGGAGAALRLWDLQGRQIADFRGYWGTIRSINFSRDGKYLVAGGDDGIPKVWRIDRDLATSIEQGCQWLKKGYLESHALAQPPC